MYVDPGDLNKRIQIVSLSDGETYDDEGHKVKDEVIVRTCWAKISNTSGTELIKAGTELSEARKRFLIRYTPVEINASMVVRYKGIDHNILYINPYGDNKEYMEIWTQIKEREARGESGD